MDIDPLRRRRLLALALIGLLSLATWLLPSVLPDPAVLAADAARTEAEARRAETVAACGPAADAACAREVAERRRRRSEELVDAMMLMSVM